MPFAYKKQLLAKTLPRGPLEFLGTACSPIPKKDICLQGMQIHLTEMAKLET
jgi:hypothetical protein